MATIQQLQRRIKTAQNVSKTTRAMQMIAASKLKKAQEAALASFPFGNTLPLFEIVYPISKMIDDYFLGGKVDKVEIISTHFINVFSQKPHLTKLLPILPQELEETEQKKATNHFELFEPDVET